LRLSAEIVQEPTAYLRARRAALATLSELRQAAENGKITNTKLEQRWLDRLSRQAEALPEDENEFIASMVPTMQSDIVSLAEYGL